MDNEVEIRVTGDDQTGGFFARLRGSVRKWGNDVGKDVNQAIGKAGTETRGNFIKRLFTPDPELVSRFTRPFASAIATPVGAAVAAALAVAISGAIGPLLVAGVGTALLGLGGLALFGGKGERDKARADLEAAKADVKDAQAAAKKGGAEAQKRLAEATKALADAQRAASKNKAFDALDRSVSKVGETLKSTLQTAAMPLLGPFTTALQTIDKAIKSMGPSLKGLFEGLAPAIQPLTEGLIGLVKNALPGLTAALPGMQTAFAAIAEVLPAIGTAFAMFMEEISSNQEAIDMVIRGVLYFAVGVLPLLGKFLAFASGRLVALVHAIQIGIAAFIRFRDAVKRYIAQVMTNIRELPGKIRAALGHLGGLLVGAGRAIMDGLLAGIRAKIAELRVTLAGITAMIPQIKGPLVKDRRLLEPAGRGLMDGLMSGIDSRLGALRNKLGGITADIPSMAAGSGRPAGGGGGRPIVIQLVMGGNDLGEIMIDPLRKSIRTRGGKVQAVLGS